MKNKQIISPVGLKGKEILERQLSLMGIQPINENENKSNSAAELTKIGPDGNAYAIVRENHDYYIKRTDKTTGLVLEDFKYIGGLQNKKSEAYPSYAKAIKQLNLKFKSLAEAFNKGGDINVFEDDNLLTEAGIAGFSQMEGSGFSGENNFEKSDEMYTEEVDEEETLEEEEDLNEFEQAIQEMMDRESDPFGDEDYMQNQVTEKKFPDLTGDGKVTRKDILQGRGVDLDEEFDGLALAISSASGDEVQKTEEDPNGNPIYTSNLNTNLQYFIGPNNSIVQLDKTTGKERVMGNLDHYGGEPRPKDLPGEMYYEGLKGGQHRLDVDDDGDIEADDLKKVRAGALGEEESIEEAINRLDALLEGELKKKVVTKK